MTTIHATPFDIERTFVKGTKTKKHMIMVGVVYKLTRIVVVIVIVIQLLYAQYVCV